MDENRRAIAEVYWAYQRDEGEPVFSEFLDHLASTPLKELAISLLEETEGLQDANLMLADALQHFAAADQRIEQRKLLAGLQRTSDNPQSFQDDSSILKKLQEQARQPDLRRVVS